MNQILQNSISYAILALVVSMIAGVGIALLYVRYLRRLRTPAQERTGVDTYGLLILGIIMILIGSVCAILLFSAYPGIVTVIILLVFLFFFTALFSLTARRGYKRSL